MSDELPDIDALLARAAAEPIGDILSEAERAYEEAMKTAVGVATDRCVIPGLTKGEALKVLAENVRALRGLMDHYGHMYNRYGS